jgi:hypothetical protein
LVRRLHCVLYDEERARRKAAHRDARGPTCRVAAGQRQDCSRQVLPARSGREPPRALEYLHVADSRAQGAKRMTRWRRNRIGKTWSQRPTAASRSSLLRGELQPNDAPGAMLRTPKCTPSAHRLAGHGRCLRRNQQPVLAGSFGRQRVAATKRDERRCPCVCGQHTDTSDRKVRGLKITSARSFQPRLAGMGSSGSRFELNMRGVLCKSPRQSRSVRP